MSNFTYEEKDNGTQFETYEWDSTWIDHADDKSRKRVLYVGDSISCGTRNIATERTNEKILFDGFGTSKALDNPFFKDALTVFAREEGPRDAILFNNGLHGWHLDDEAEYGNYYEEMIKFMLEEFKGTPLFIVLTTHIADEEREKRVVIRNKVACEIAKKYNLPVIDFYSVSLKAKDLLSADGVHFTRPGYEALADEVIHAVSEVIK